MTHGTRIAIVALLAALTACSDQPTAPSIADLEQAQASWQSHHLTRYAYRYEFTGSLNVFAGRAMRLVVLADTVRSAQFVDTNDPVPFAPETLPTIDALFAMAIAARQDGTLHAVQFDSTYGFPARMDMSGPPDASGSMFASNIELLP